MAQLSAVVTGVGGFLPSNRVSNHDLAKTLDTSDEWIVGRTGISFRHLAAPNETTSDLAAAALKAALSDANLAAKDLDGIIVATTTPDLVLPSTAALVQQKVGAGSCMALDINAVCSGFIYAMVMAQNLIQSGQLRAVAVIGADTMSRIVDWQDRSTCVLFGDGAGAVIIQGKQQSQSIEPAKISGMVAWALHSDGNLCHILETDGGISRAGAHVLKMQGKEVYRHGVEKMHAAMLETLEKAQLQVSDIDYIIPHQANVRMINAIAERLGVGHERAIVTVGEQANTAAASIPLAWDWAKRQGMIKPGQLLALPAAGAGFTWGNILLRV